MVVHLIDGTYELFRHFYGQRRFKGAARIIDTHGHIEDFPPALLGEQRDLALLFKRLATLRIDAKLFRDVKQIEWRGPTKGFAEWTERFGAPRLAERAAKVSMTR